MRTFLIHFNAIGLLIMAALIATLAIAHLFTAYQRLRRAQDWPLFKRQLLRSVVALFCPRMATLLMIGLLSLFSEHDASAQQYGAYPIVYTSGANLTNATGTATNIAGITNNVNTANAGIVSATKYTDFTLLFDIGLTNASAATLDVQWDTSLDGVNFCTSKACAPGSGWFSIPLTNAGTHIIWQTNITLNSAGFWRLGWLTNSAVQHMTNLIITPYMKPQRNGP